MEFPPNKSWIVMQFVLLIPSVVALVLSLYQVYVSIRYNNSTVLSRKLHPLTVASATLLVLRSVDPANVNMILPYELNRFVSDTTTCCLIAVATAALSTNLVVAWTEIQPKAKRDLRYRANQLFWAVFISTFVMAMICSAIQVVTKASWPYATFMIFTLLLVLGVCVSLGVVTQRLLFVITRTQAEADQWRKDENNIAMIQYNTALKKIYVLRLILLFLFIVSIVGVCVSFPTIISNSKVRRNSPTRFNFGAIWVMCVHVVTCLGSVWYGWLPARTREKSSHGSMRFSVPQTPARVPRSTKLLGRSLDEEDDQRTILRKEDEPGVGGSEGGGSEAQATQHPDSGDGRAGCVVRLDEDHPARESSVHILRTDIEMTIASPSVIDPPEGDFGGGIARHESQEEDQVSNQVLEPQEKERERLDKEMELEMLQVM